MFKKKKSYLRETTIAIIESVNDLMIAVRSWLACAVYRTLLTVIKKTMTYGVGNLGPGLGQA
jgi:hypothetical protein